jgi:quinol monooxygenase YgiN
MIHIVAIITAKPGLRDQILEAVKINTPLVRAEEGCIEYCPMIDVDAGGPAKFGPDTFVVVEKWRDDAALDAHRKAAHMAVYLGKTKDLVASRSVHILKAALD